MAQRVNKYIYWTPRIVSILFISFLALMSLDVFAPGLSWQQILIGLLMHNIPVFILSAVLVISWKYEIVGGVVFILGGLLYIAQMVVNMFQNGFAGYLLSYSFTVAGPAILIGLLFILNWVSRNQKAPPYNQH